MPPVTLWLQYIIKLRIVNPFFAYNFRLLLKGYTRYIIRMAARLFRFPSARTKAQQILGRMAADGLVNRFRVGRGEYIYHQGRRSKKWRHWLELSRFHFALEDELKNWQRIIFWQLEVKYPFGIADGFYIVRTTIDGAGMMFYLEVDDGGNTFDKVGKYAAYYRSKAWRGEWWAGGGAFPLVLVVTPRVQMIKAMVEGSRGGCELFRVIGRPVGILEALKA